VKSRALILAAGKGKRMKSEKSKVLHEIAGKSLIEYVVDALDITEIGQTGVIVSEQNINEIRSVLGNRVEYIIQKEQLGTGHAVLSAANWLEGFDGRIVVVVGDTPFIDKQTIRDMLTEFEANNSTCVLLSAIYDKPPAYGRVVRNKNGIIIKVVEEKDASEEEKKIKEVSTSHYCFDALKLLSALRLIKNENAQGEYYLPDVIEIFIQKGENVQALPVSDPMITFGINSQEDLLMAEKRILDAGQILDDLIPM
jgi:bifunctional UDP-N-acetylglucosamine pyrophosphorylase/glucosamine-1-phosphate N-acetyltransferase